MPRKNCWLMLEALLQPFSPAGTAVTVQGSPAAVCDSARPAWPLAVLEELRPGSGHSAPTPLLLAAGLPQAVFPAFCLPAAWFLGLLCSAGRSGIREWPGAGN